jgi:hypothetical protein
LTELIVTMLAPGRSFIAGIAARKRCSRRPATYDSPHYGDLMTERAAPGDQFVQSLARGLEVIVSFDDEHPEMTLAQVATRTGYGRATARRFLRTLVELGYMRTDGRTFSLTPNDCPPGSASRPRPPCSTARTSSTSPASRPGAS